MNVLSSGEQANYMLEDSSQSINQFNPKGSKYPIGLLGLIDWGLGGFHRRNFIGGKPQAIKAYRGTIFVVPSSFYSYHLSSDGIG
jgi:hypothetical protein